MTFARRCAAVAATVSLALLAAVPATFATIAPRPGTTSYANAQQVADAMAASGVRVTGAAFVTEPALGGSAAISTHGAQQFPRQGSDFAILSTGHAARVFGGQRNQLSADLGGIGMRGNRDRDVTIVRIDFDVLAGRNCLGFDVRMLSEEYPDFPGKIYNDAFVAELDITDWTTIGPRVIAPHNFAFRTDTIDGNGQPLNIRTTGATSASAANALGTRFNGATPLLRATTPIAPGTHSLYLSLFDQGDAVFDTAVFMDRLRAYPTSRTACPLGAFPLIRPTVKNLPQLETTDGLGIFRADVTSESAIGVVTTVLDGRVVSRVDYTRRDVRELELEQNVNLNKLRPGVHKLLFKVANRAGTTVLRQTVGG